jgi:hypothetical protein
MTEPKPRDPVEFPLPLSDLPVIDVLSMGGQTTKPAEGPLSRGEPDTGPSLPTIWPGEVASGFGEAAGTFFKRLTPNIGPGAGVAAGGISETREPSPTLSHAIGKLLFLPGTLTGVTSPPLTTEQAGSFWNTLAAIEPVSGGVGRFMSAAAGAFGRRGLSAFETTVTPASNMPVVKKLVGAIDEAAPLVEQVTTAKRKARGTRIAKFQERMADEAQLSPSVFRRATGALTGELVEPSPPLTTKFTPVEVDELMRVAWLHSDEGYAQLNNVKAVVDLLEGRLPQPAQLRRLNDIFGSEVIEAFTRSQKAGTWDTVVDILGLPRAILSSFDLSAPLRQGWLLTTAHPKESIPAMRAMMRAFLSEKAFGEIENSIRAHRFFDLSETAGLERTFRVGAGIKASAREEAFMTSLAQQIPGIRMSERAYVGYLNKLRSDVFYKVASDWEGMGKTMVDYQELANFINVATGRGNLGKFSGKTAELLNVMFFSPRFVVSRPQYIWQGVQSLDSNRATSALWARSTVAAFGSSMTLLGLMKLIPGAEVELDPRSSDFGKGRIGKTRFDFFGGFQPLFRYTAQITTGKRKTSTGKERIIDRQDAIEKLIQSKLSPAAGLAADIITGTTFTGQEFPGTEAGAFTEQMYNRLVPMFIQDLEDAVEAEGPIGLLMAAPGVLGVGVQSYERPMDVKNDKADELGFDSYDDAPIEVQNAIDIDPGVARTINEMREGYKPFLNRDEELQAGLDAHNKRVTELEKGSEREPGLRTLIEGGTKREHLRNAVQRYLAAKANSWDANISHQLEKLMEERTTELLDVYRARYWSADAPIDIASGIPDFDARDEAQEKILEEAQSRGLNRRDVTFRLSLEDKVVDETVRAYFAAQEFLRPYFDLTKNMMAFADHLGDKDIYADLYSEYRHVPKSDQNLFLYGQILTGRLTTDEFKNFMKMLSDAPRRRRNWRIKNDAEYDRLLLQWGWVTKPVNSAVIEEEDKRKNRRLQESIGAVP